MVTVKPRLESQIIWPEINFMCGISVLISNHESDLASLVDMNSQIDHRGPDDEGFVLFDKSQNPIVLGSSKTPIDCLRSNLNYIPANRIDETINNTFNVGLGHRRLSIVDLSPLGHQPMCDHSGRYWITYNGEVYNYKEIRLELEELGYRFISKSDTEVIIYAYIAWGEKCLQKFNGMWAFGIYDNLENSFFFARDRFGVKPLYYWISKNKELLLASEIKQFTSFKDWEAHINPQRAYDFLAYGYMDHTDETLFKNVFQLPAGHFIKFNINDLDSFSEKLPVKRWYEIPDTKFDGTYEEAKKKFEEIFIDAVRLRLRSDVPIGSCLSGGLDSSSIVGVMNYLLKTEHKSFTQKTFSLCSHEKEFDESDYIKTVVESTQSDASYTYPDPYELFEKLSLLTWVQDEPFGSSSIYAQWKVFESAAKGNVKVMLDGQGGDEILSGYRSFFGPRLGELLRNLSFIQLIREKKALEKKHNYRGFKKDILKAVLPFKLFKWAKSHKNHHAHSYPWLNYSRFFVKNEYSAPSAVGQSSGVNSLAKYQVNSSIIPRLLHWEDRDSMCHSIESRVPFLDYRLVEFSLSLPSKYRIENGITKRILRDSLVKYVPSKILNRHSKLGFETPEEIWIKSKIGFVFREKIQAAISKSNGLLTNEALSLFDDVYQGKKTYDHHLWRIISFGNWIEVFKVKV